MLKSIPFSLGLEINSCSDITCFSQEGIADQDPPKCGVLVLEITDIERSCRQTLAPDKACFVQGECILLFSLVYISSDEILPLITELWKLSKKDETKEGSLEAKASLSKIIQVSSIRFDAARSSRLQSTFSMKGLLTLKNCPQQMSRFPRNGFSKELKEGSSEGSANHAKHWQNHTWMMYSHISAHRAQYKKEDFADLASHDIQIFWNPLGSFN